MHILTMPPGARAKAHLHESHETAIYVLSGEVDTWYGDELEHHIVVKAGDLLAGHSRPSVDEAPSGPRPTTIVRRSIIALRSCTRHQLVDATVLERSASK